MTARVRFVTATSLFDGHDASINIIRRVLQSSGAEVIHLAHNRSALEIAEAAVQEDAQAVAVTSYQGGHMEFFRYLRQLMDQRGGSHVLLFGGGGGTILPEESERLLTEGVARIYSPDDGRRLGFQGMVDDMLAAIPDPTGLDPPGPEGLSVDRPSEVARLITAAENGYPAYDELKNEIHNRADASSAPVVGITGTGGSGKSSLVDELLRRYLAEFENRTVAVISVDPSKRRTGGALLGDRIRMNAVTNPRAYMRSLATRQANLALSPHVSEAVAIVKAAGYDLIILETSGIGQSDTEIVDHSDLAVYVMTPEFGAATQLEKIDMLDFADLVAINKFDRLGAEDALRDVRKQYQRNHKRFDDDPVEMPVYATVASQFGDPGTTRFYRALMDRLTEASGLDFVSRSVADGDPVRLHIIPPDRVRYLSDVSETIRTYDRRVQDQAALAERLYRLDGALDEVDDERLRAAIDRLEQELDADARTLLEEWPKLVEAYEADTFTYQVRGEEIKVEQYRASLAHTQVPRVILPRYRSWGDRLRWLMQENVPGRFPFTGGVYPFKRQTEDPTRMFAGEGGPEQTNRRFHYLSEGMPAARLSTAFDSVTLYGEDPHSRPDVYGKVGNSGVSVASLDDAKKLYSGFDLCEPSTSVSMTINGPAPIVLGFFLNAAIDQQCELFIRRQGLEDEVRQRIEELLADKDRPQYRGELPSGHDGLGLMLLGVTGDRVLPAETYSEIKATTLRLLRGTVQADILKEDQAQNTCIFSTDFALRMMGDIQQYFVDNDIRNFYSVSISGYHMAEAGANPITQLAFTLANGFTFIEYYLARGMEVDDFAPNLSFFFSNGLDPEYAVIGRVARRIWAKALRDRYQAGERSQKLKYHIQTSGRSLHAQEISFNDIRTTLQALYAIYDNTNSLHTNAYDEAITTPTEESVRRALAIQLIISKELGLAKNENPLQGSFIVEELTDLVEEAVLAEFDRLTERGGVLGAMETMYQRSKIQEESLHYEQLKERGEYPIVGVTTFLSAEGSPFVRPDILTRSTDDEKEALIATVEAVRSRWTEQIAATLDVLRLAALSDANVFEALMEATKVCSLGQLSQALYETGGRYRRNM